MSLRVIEIIAPTDDEQSVRDSLDKLYPDENAVYWVSALKDDFLSFRLVHDMQESEDIMDKLDDLFDFSEEYRLVIYPAQATLPRFESEAADKDVKKKERIGREELYNDLLDASLLSKSYLTLTFLAAVVAVIGLARDNVAVIIGSMVLAPMLGPNVALSLATTLGDVKLAFKAATTMAIGAAISLVVAVFVGLVFGASADSQQLIDRCTTHFSDIVLAMASGGAGILAFTMGAPTSIVGVMVALALLPPLSAAGIMLGAGNFTEAGGAALLFATNIISLNLAGVGMFLLQGVKPLKWREQEKARITALRILILWGCLLATLAVVIHYARHGSPDFWPETYINRLF